MLGLVSNTNMVPLLLTFCSLTLINHLIELTKANARKANNMKTLTLRNTLLKTISKTLVGVVSGLALSC